VAGDLGECVTAFSLPRSTRKVLVIGAYALGAAVIVGIALLHFYWPFTEAAVRRELGNVAVTNVTFREFHDKYFPPGCVAEGVVFQRDGSNVPLITIQRLVIRSNIFGLMHRHVSLIRLEGAQANWQQVGKRADQNSKPTVIDRFVADGAVLEIPRNSPDGPLRFAFHKFEVGNLRGPGQSTFAAELDNPLPHGLVRVSGHFGPWNNAQAAKTALDGNYSLEHGDLGVFHSIGGLVSSSGRFSGVFEKLEVQGQTSTPEFEVTSTQHHLPLETHFHGVVEGPSGNVSLSNVKAQFGRDVLDAHGTIARGDDGKRVADFDIRCDHGRIEDTFYPFIHSPRSPLAGKVNFRMHVVIRPGKEKFVQRLVLQSSFDIDDAQFTHPQTQLRLSKVAEGPDQGHPDTGPSAQFQGQVSMKDGVAHFSSLTLQDQGAAAVFRGSFSLTGQRVNMRGKLKTEASLTNATHGIKSVFAKVVEPFFKKKPHETVVPVKIGGTYSHPHFGLDLNDKM
jgi:hypothetical protein